MSHQSCPDPLTFVRRVRAEDPAALRLFAEQHLVAAHRITYRYTTTASEWYAQPYKRFVSVPPPIDLVALAVIGHEVGHVLAGRCPDTGSHFDRREGNKRRCLECERTAWALCEPLLPPPTREMHQRMQSALGSYRAVTLAPPDAQRAADEHMSTLRRAVRVQAAWKWEDRLARQERANASLARDAEKAGREAPQICGTASAARGRTEDVVSGTTKAHTEDGRRIISGIAIPFNALSLDLGGFVEKFAPTAVDRTLREIRPAPSPTQRSAKSRW